MRKTPSPVHSSLKSDNDQGLKKKSPIIIGRDMTSKFIVGSGFKKEGGKENHNNMGSCALGELKQFKLLNCQVVRTETHSSLELNPSVALLQAAESTGGRGRKEILKFKCLLS